MQVSKSVLLLESKFGLMGAFVTFWDARRPTCWPTPARGPYRRSQAGGQPPGVADAAGQPAVPAQPHEGTLGALPLGSSRARLFFWPRSGLPGNVFRGRAVVLSGGRSFSIGRLFEHFRDRNALGFAQRRTSKLVGRAATQLNANSSR